VVEVYVAANTGILCSLLAHEVLSNCLQHAFPARQAGDITITLQTEPPGQLTLTIRDTGIVFSADLGMRHQQSFGLQLVGALTEQLRGTITFTRDHGTSVTLRFPI
jgi:two-component sensor histidine kinase